MNIQVDFKKLITWLIPIPILFSRIKALVYVFVKEVKFIHGKVLTSRANFLYYLEITPQVCKLEKMLNDRYDPIQRRIYIADGSDFDPIYMYQKAEDKPVFFYLKSEAETDPIFYKKNEISSDSQDFVVFVPLSLTFSEAEMSALLDTFKLAGTIYTIQKI